MNLLTLAFMELQKVFQMPFVYSPEWNREEGSQDQVVGRREKDIVNGQMQSVV